MNGSGASCTPFPAAPAEIEIRPLRTADEYRACLELQRATWGEQFSELVPSIILKISQRIGGVAAGAFDAEGCLLGFVFGMTGVEKGRLVHWSDMLAVREEARDLGLGRQLKEFQRDAVRALGVEVIYWSYDPLVARNAHLNLNRLGTEVVEYVQDMYGDTASDLHDGLGTDRFVVAWRIAGNQAQRREPEDPSRWRMSSVLNPAPGERAHPEVTEPIPAAAELRIQIPLDIHQVKAASAMEAAEWRTVTRHAFLHCFERGYRVVGFYRDDAAERGYYLLTRVDAAEGGG
ncbi:MAG TPA: hypothetical protein VGR27_03350 [Longimicrobiaceae bacterium]|nr:hypothetical protein [Longimicrobiaceae bacterium]